MKIKVLEKSANELKIEIEGEGHTFCNVLQKAILKDDTVEMGGYNIPHPLVSSPIVYVRTKGRRKPETALRDAAEKVRSLDKVFTDSFEKALKEWEKTRAQTSSEVSV
jgi:DNA-directed RNA polymerase subunit L